RGPVRDRAEHSQDCCARTPRWGRLQWNAESVRAHLHSHAGAAEPRDNAWGWDRRASRRGAFGKVARLIRAARDDATAWRVATRRHTAMEKAGQLKAEYHSSLLLPHPCVIFDYWGAMRGRRARSERGVRQAQYWT